MRYQAINFRAILGDEAGRIFTHEFVTDTMENARSYARRVALSNNQSLVTVEVTRNTFAERDPDT